MGSPTSRVVFRTVVVALLLLLVFYIGRPLYWKISATVHDIRNNKQTVREGFSLLFRFQFPISVPNFQLPFSSLLQVFPKSSWRLRNLWGGITTSPTQGFVPPIESCFFTIPFLHFLLSQILTYIHTCRHTCHSTFYFSTILWFAQVVLLL